jgi:hypothetical protein
MIVLFLTFLDNTVVSGRWAACRPTGMPVRPAAAGQKITNN